MAAVDGAYDCLIKSPLGEQKTVFTVVSDGDVFTGSNVGDMGSLDVIDGKVDGNTLTWKMDLKVPMPITLDCKGTVEGDALTASVTAGAFGTFPMTGTRKP